MQKPTFQGEIMLAGWQESHTAGAKVTFWLPDSESLEVFKGMTAKKGNTAGQRFMAVLVEIGEDELPVASQEGKPKGGELARLAGMWCQDRKFRDWIAEEKGVLIYNEMEAAEWLRQYLDIPSRAILDSDPLEAEAFHKLIRIPYSEWLKKHGG